MSSETTEPSNRDLAPLEPGTLQELEREFRQAFRTARGDSDLEIVHLYLRELKGGQRPCSDNTVRNYRRVVLRWLQWYATYHYGRPLRDFSREDVIDYREFMRKPPSDWIGPKRVKDPADRKPFEGPLSENEVERNCRIISGFFDYAVSQGRCDVNPFRQKGPQGLKTQEVKSQERYLDPVMWDALWETIEAVERQAELADDDKLRRRVARNRWVLQALYIPAMRPDELAASSGGQLRISHRGRWLHIPSDIGKGGKEAYVPVPEAYVQAMAHYRRLNGIRPEIPGPRDTWPLVLDLDGRRRIGTRQCYNVAVEMLRETADHLENKGDPQRAETVRSASGHWFRHSRATHLLDANVDRRLVRAIMRHSRDSTLDQYVHSDDAKKQEAAALALDGLIPTGSIDAEGDAEP